MVEVVIMFQAVEVQVVLVLPVLGHKVAGPVLVEMECKALYQELPHIMVAVVGVEIQYHMEEIVVMVD
jgi:hypothetical protein